MLDLPQILLLLGVLCGLLVLRCPMPLALGAASLLGIAIVRRDLEGVWSVVSAVLRDAVASDALAVAPLLVLAGALLTASGGARDVLLTLAGVLRRVPGGEAPAICLANSLCSLVVGTSNAAAVTSARIVWPVMKRRGYDRQFALGSIAAAACLGVLAPPSVLLIAWSALSGEPFARLIQAGAVPLLLLTTTFIAVVMLTARSDPRLVGHTLPRASSVGAAAVGAGEERSQAAAGPIANGLPVIALASALLVALWARLLTPPQAAAATAALALILTVIRGLGRSPLFRVLLAGLRTSAQLLMLLVAAMIYGRMLTEAGISGSMKWLLLRPGLVGWQALIIMVAIWFVLGCVLDSLLTVVLTVPLLAPAAAALGYDPAEFAVLGILVVEIGLLTPPLGMLAYTMRAALPRENVPPSEVFAGAAPFWISMLAVILAVAVAPPLATWLPGLPK